MARSMRNMQKKVDISTEMQEGEVALEKRDFTLERHLYAVLSPQLIE